MSRNRITRRARANKARAAKGRRGTLQRHPEVCIWLGAGALTLGIGAALASGAAVAHADSSHNGGSRPPGNTTDTRSFAGPKVGTTGTTNSGSPNNSRSLRPPGTTTGAAANPHVATPTPYVPVAHPGLATSLAPTALHTPALPRSSVTAAVTPVTATPQPNNAIINAEQALWNGVGQLEQPLVPYFESIYGGPPTVIPTVPTNVSPLSLLVGGTTFPVISPQLAGLVAQLYGLPAPYALYTPEQFWPFTPQLGNLTLGQSISQGASLLTAALNTQIAAGNQVTVGTSSQSSAVATVSIEQLMAEGSPGQNLVRFGITGDPNNPNGGPLARFPGLYIPILDIMFNGATPPNSPYPTKIFTNQYDGVADFPRYPLNLISDANAVAGFWNGQHDYVVPLAFHQLPTSPGYTGNTQYFMSLTQNLPLTDPLRYDLPAPYGYALADLIQPDLRVIVDMGYGSGEYANIPTPASLLELPNPFTILPDLVAGTIQGPQAALVDLGVLPVSMYPTAYPFTPVLDPGLNFPLPQTGVTGLSLLSGFEGQLLRGLGLVPAWST